MSETLKGHIGVQCRCWTNRLQEEHLSWILVLCLQNNNSRSLNHRPTRMTRQIQLSGVTSGWLWVWLQLPWHCTLFSAAGFKWKSRELKNRMTLRNPHPTCLPLHLEIKKTTKTTQQGEMDFTFTWKLLLIQLQTYRLRPCPHLSG